MVIEGAAGAGDTGVVAPFASGRTTCDATLLVSPEVSARVVIEQAGLKGTKVGGAEVSDRHANFIVAQPGATAADVLGLIDLIRQQVRLQFGYELELQIQVW